MLKTRFIGSDLSTPPSTSQQQRLPSKTICVFPPLEHWYTLLPPILAQNLCAEDNLIYNPLNEPGKSVKNCP
jgi:hypothetical protein